MKNGNAESLDGHELQFWPLTEFEQGTLYSLLSESYAGLIEAVPQYAEMLQRQWQETDTFAFSMKDTPIAECFFVTCSHKTPIGMGSIDPRNLPTSASIGQNCLLPAYRGRGYGTRQLHEMLRRLRQRRASRIVVVTSHHPFFLPAQRMYQSNGFRETRRFPGNFAECIQYELTHADDI
jgi:ribosomal protein S18 acetylase RimI-like enzyme